VAPAIEAKHDVVSKIYENDTLYTQSLPFNEGYLQVSDLHSIYYAEFGNPQGLPVVTVHGGPGSQCYASWTAFFDQQFYHIIMFDQRGAGRSKPFAEMNENNPQNSIEDMEKLRNHLAIDKWILFGGSYGSFLSILYGETHPERCFGFILRGIFLGRQQDYSYLFYGMKSYYPEAWDEMVELFPEDERSDLISSFYTRIMDPDPSIHLAAARAFMRFDTYCAHLVTDAATIDNVDQDDISTLGIGRAFIYYAAHAFFIEENQILNNLHKVSHLPAIVVQGRYDLICPPQGAYDLYKQWPTSELWFISDAGHSSKEPGIAQGLKEASENMKSLIGN
jgi:proline iminopeptidase